LHEDCLILLKGVSKEYAQGAKAVRALDYVNLSIPRAAFVAIIGPSGSGKSTLLNQLGALDLPSSGQVLIDGVDLASLSESELTRYRREKVGFVFQNFNLIPNLTALENVMLPMEFARLPRAEAAERAHQLLALVKMEKRAAHVPAKLSGGEQQRVAIARALANDPPIVLTDEPTGNLDSATGEQIVSLLQALVQEKGKSVIVITHNPAVGDQADQLIQIRDGRVEADPA
jgi:putative ABC transport system ATP-binding protein